MHSSPLLAMCIAIDALPPLTATATARFTSKVADPIRGLMAVNLAAGSVIRALQPAPGHEIRHDQASTHLNP